MYCVYMTLTLTAGRYLFLEASRDMSGALPEHAARLLSPDLRYTPGAPEHEQAPFCLEFWYHMRGAHIGRLSVYQYDNPSAPTSRYQIWSVQGNRGTGMCWTGAL